MARNAPPARRSIWLPLFLLGGVSLLAVGGSVAALAAMGVELPFLQAAKPPMIRIPSSVRPIAAYERVSRNDLIHPEKGQIHYLEMPVNSAIGAQIVGANLSGEKITGRVAGVEQREYQGNVYPFFVLAEGGEIPLPNADEIGGAYLNPQDVIGRVVANEKSPGFGFTESNFLPKGTRPGLVGGVPPGMKAITLLASKLAGVHSLNLGDRIDLLATLDVDRLSPNSSLGSRTSATSLPRSSDKRGAKKDGPKEARLIAVDAQVISPVFRRAKVVTSSSLTQGTTGRNVPVEEVTLAVHEADVPAVTEASVMDCEIAVIAHSARPEPEEAAPPEGMVSVPLNPRRAIPYSQIQEADLWPTGTRTPRTILIAQAEVARMGILTEPNEIVGRVLKAAKPPGTFFTEADFYPIGTTAGLTAAVPTGYRAFTLDAALLDGIAALQLGDRFDLIASRSIDFQKVAQKIGGSDIMLATAIRDGALKLDGSVQMETLLRNAIVIAPPGSTALRYHGSKISSNGKQAAQPMVIALSPAETTKLTEALASEMHLTAVARRDDESEIPPAADPLDGVRTLDAVVGRKRQTLVFLTDEQTGPAQPLDLQGLLPAKEE
ncbi:CpaB family protein [Blastopirellula retiformator]|uniref:SAF domain-containing protein n=1 Tax=Blastopirellula retiformator TaxID=2527970 RepID=A0A5C5VA82_9BACT|nr:hypothetical protein [Blastopirellula retiformator]TWT34612.1 hypothetical protein Enr8_20250 [Blastopirellula retiformator]